MQDLSCVFDQHQSSWQCQILNPLSKVRPDSMSLSGIHRSRQTKTPAHERTDELYSTSGSGESEEDNARAKKEKDIGPMSLPKEKLAQSQKKIAQLIKGKMVKQKLTTGIINKPKNWKWVVTAEVRESRYPFLRAKQGLGNQELRASV
uniref:Uncharacterized protein n=1 Tax=Sus scrofa TaxID=9823 RepID=A0A8D0NGG7_PIG